MVNDPGKNNRHAANHASLLGSGTYTHAQIDTHIDAAGALSELDTVGTAEIDDASVTNAKLADNSVTFTKIAAESVSTSRLADDAVTTAKLATDSVTTDALDLSITPTWTGEHVFGAGVQAGYTGTYEDFLGTLAYVGGGSYSNNSNPITGAIKVELPTITTNYMLSFTVSIYEYKSNQSIDVRISGYARTGFDSWLNTSVCVVGPNRTDQYTPSVRFAHSAASTRPCVYIGGVADAWYYPKVSVRNFHAGYSTQGFDAFKDGWAISVVTAFEATSGSTQTHTNDRVLAATVLDSGITAAKIGNNAVTTDKILDGTVTAAKLADGPGSGVDADTVDGIQAASFIRSDTSDTATGAINFTATSTYTAELKNAGSGAQAQFSGFSVLPTGYAYTGMNFRFDASSSAWLLYQDGNTYSMLAGTDPGGDVVNRMFGWTNDYLNLNTYKDVSDVWGIEIVGLSLSNSSNTWWRPYVVWHSGECDVKVEFRAGDNTTWVTAHDGPSGKFLLPFAATNVLPGIVTGLRYTFSGITTNRYLKMLGLTSTTAASYQWPLLRSGGELYGTVDSQDLIARTTDVYDIGSSSKKYRNLHLSGAITVDGLVDGRNPSVDGGKLDGIESGATADQAWGDIAGTLSSQTDLQSALDAKALTSHTHTLADVTDSGALAALGTVGTAEIDALAVTSTKLSAALQSEIDGKALASHTHTLADVTDSGALAALGTVGTAQIDALAVTSAKISAALQTEIDGKALAAHTHTLAAVTDSGALAALDTVGTAQIDGLSITAPKMGPNSVETTSIVANAILEANIADSAVATAKIANLAVTAGKLAAAVQADIDGKALLAHTHTLADVTDSGALAALNAVGSTEITDASVIASKLGALSVQPAALGTGSVQTAKLADNAVSTVKISDLNVTTAKIANLAVTSAKISAALQTEIDGKALVAHKSHKWADEEYAFEGYAGENYLSLFTNAARGTLTRFAAPSAAEYWDGAAWVTWATGADDIKIMLDGQHDTHVDVDQTHKKFRFEFTSWSGWPSLSLIVLKTTWDNHTYVDGFIVEVEHWDGAAWVLVSTCDFTANKGDGQHIKAESHMHTGDTLWRVTINTGVITGTSPWAGIVSFEIFSNFNGRAPDPWSWGWDKKVDFDVTPTVGGTALSSSVHTHTLADVTGSGALAALGTVGTAQIDALAVTSAKISAALQTEIDGKALASHTHTLADVTDSGALAALSTVGTAQIDALAVTSAKISAALQTEIDGKALASHTHTLADVTDSGALAALSTVGTAQIDALAVTSAKISAALQTEIDGKALASHTHTLADVTDSGALAALSTVGSAEIDNAAVTLPKLANIATDSFLGRTTAATGAVEVLSATDARAVLNVEDGSTADQAWGDIAGTLSSQTDLQSALDAKSATTHTHTLADVTDSGALAALSTVGTSEIANLAVTSAKISAALQTELDGKALASHAHTLADVTDSGALAALSTVSSAELDVNAVLTTRIKDQNVTLAKLEAVATATFLGRHTAATGAVEAITADQARTNLNVADGSTADLSLGNADQSLTANRTVTIPTGTNPYLYFFLIDDTGLNNKTASLIVQPSLPRVVITAAETGVASTSLQVGTAGIDYTLTGSDQRINGDPGTAGDQYQSAGTGSPPVWAAGIVHSATAPDTSQLWYHTTDDIVYFYDSTRAKWLSVNEYTVDASLPIATITVNAIMQQNGVSLLVSSVERGHPLPYDCTVTGWYWRHGGAAIASRELALGRFDDSAGTNNTRHYSVTPTSWQEFVEDDLDADFDTQDLLGLVAFGTTSMAYVRCTVTYRRRTS